jgi:GxxExxY protein
MNENEISKIVVNLSFKLHKEYGPGLFESVYEKILCYELEKAGLTVRRQQGIPLRYDNLTLDLGFRADIIIENKVIIEVKSVDAICDIHNKQVLTYLKLSGIKLGLLINFNVVMLKEGIKRLVNNL